MIVKTACALLLVAIAATLLGASQVLAEVPLAGNVRFSELSWGGNLRSGILVGLLVSSLVLLLLRQPIWAVLPTAIAFGFLFNIGLAAQQWYNEKMSLLESMGAMGASAVDGVKWQWPVFSWGVAGISAVLIPMLIIFSSKNATPHNSTV